MAQRAKTQPAWRSVRRSHTTRADNPLPQVLLQGVQDCAEPADEDDVGGVWAAQAEDRLHPAAPWHRGHRPVAAVPKGLVYVPSHLRSPSTPVVHRVACTVLLFRLYQRTALCLTATQQHFDKGNYSVDRLWLRQDPLVILLARAAEREARKAVHARARRAAAAGPHRPHHPGRQWRLLGEAFVLLHENITEACLNTAFWETQWLRLIAAPSCPTTAPTV